MKYLLAIMIVTAGCTSNVETVNTIESGSRTVYSKENISSGCYRIVVDKDSAIMNLELRGADSAIGSLQYNRFEKDDNIGEFVGRIDSNKVVGWYKFQSEGIITVRQVVFKIIGNDKLAEGYGDVSATGDTAYFAYIHTLNYEEAHPFEKIVCP